MTLFFLDVKDGNCKGSIWSETFYGITFNYTRYATTLPADFGLVHAF